MPVTQHFTLDMDAFHHALEGAKLVCVVHTSNVLGVRNPLEDIIAASHKVGAKVLIDAAQGVPHSTVDFTNFGADFMAFSAHKMCGPTGIGALLVQPETFEEMQPFMGGGDMIETVTVDGSTYQTNEHKFEAGTPRIAEAIGWSAALDWMDSFDLDAEHTRLVKIASWVAEELRAMGMTVYGRHDEHDAAVVSFLHPTINSEDMAHLLDSRGLQCAPVTTALNRSSTVWAFGTVRASFYVYNTREEAEGLVQELKEITEKFAAFYPEALQELVEEFQEVEDKRERLEMLFELADEIVELPATEWSEETSACEAASPRAHVRVRVEEGLVHFFGAADAKLVQGLMGVLSIAIEGLTPAQAVLIPVDFAQEMGLTNSLTPRSNGFRNMYDKVMNEIRASVE